MNIEEIATKEDLRPLRESLDYLIRLIKESNEARQNTTMSVNELAQRNIIGGRDRIKTLIRMGKLQTTADGKITEKALNEYLNHE